jgi:hypothetical protein
MAGKTAIKALSRGRNRNRTRRSGDWAHAGNDRIRASETAFQKRELGNFARFLNLSLKNQ